MEKTFEISTANLDQRALVKEFIREHSDEILPCHCCGHLPAICVDDLDEYGLHCSNDDCAEFPETGAGNESLTEAMAEWNELNKI